MVVTRFAPSPTGYLHFGNVRAALFNALFARRHGGVMQLRIEDTDRARSEARFDAAIVEDLQWLGVDFAGDASGEPWRQSRRGAEYAGQFERLRAGGYVYPCFCSDEQLAAGRAAQLARGEPPRYDGTCAGLSSAESSRRLSAGAAAAWRFRVPRNERLTLTDLARGDATYDTNAIGDFIIRRAGGDFSFLFTNAADDALLGVTDAIRGEDHAANTPRQQLLFNALGFAPPRYAHLPLIVNAAGKPLSKRDGLAPIRDYRARGYLPGAIVNYLARVGHTLADNALMTADELAQRFSLSALGRAPAIYDEAQLLYWQKESVLSLSAGEYRAFIGEERLNAVSIVSVSSTSSDSPSSPTSTDEKTNLFCRLLREEVIFPSDADSWAKMLTDDTLSDIEPDAARVIADAAAGNDNFYPAAAQAATSADDWQSFCAAVGAATGAKGKALFMPLRAALTGKTKGPAMPLIYELLTPQQRAARLAAAATMSPATSR